MKTALLIGGFGVIFVGMWIQVAKRVAQHGWSAVALKHRAMREPFGTKIGGVSGWFSRSSYSSTLSVWITQEGMFIRPIFFFRAFHPALLLSWSHVISVSEEKKFLSWWTTVECEIDGTPLLLKVPGNRASDFQSHVSKRPNKAPEPTPTSVMPRANEGESE